MSKLHQKLAAITKAIVPVTKDTNETAGYDYLSEAAILKEVRDKLIEHKIHLATSIIDQQMVEVKSDGGIFGFMFSVGTEHTFTDCETGEKLVLRGMGQGFDTLDKGGYKARTGALKYCLRENFLIPGKPSDDPDSDQRMPKQLSDVTKMETGALANEHDAWNAKMNDKSVKLTSEELGRRSEVTAELASRNMEEQKAQTQAPAVPATNGTTEAEPKRRATKTMVEPEPKDEKAENLAKAKAAMEEAKAQKEAKQKPEPKKEVTWRDVIVPVGEPGMGIHGSKLGDLTEKQVGTLQTMWLKKPKIQESIKEAAAKGDQGAIYAEAFVIPLKQAINFYSDRAAQDPGEFENCNALAARLKAEKITDLAAFINLNYEAGYLNEVKPFDQLTEDEATGIMEVINEVVKEFKKQNSALG